MLRFRHRILSVSFVSCLTLTAVGGPASSAARIEFNRDIRPIITENCFACHGPDKNQRKAKLRLDVREVAVERGAIVPGKPGESKLIDHVNSADPDEVMPPPKTRKTLTAAQKQVLAQWIAAGAEYEPHWAYMKLQRPPLPSLEHPGWVRNPIDAFVLHDLETKNIRPSPEAAKPVLLRRVSLDLIGLPPTPAEEQAFMADKSANAYEHQVDRLLHSPHFGERMAVPWLDIVRFADTVGYHGDQNQHVFPYRDYVIDSFNRDKPFDQFTIEQIAGDLLPNPTDEQRVATCFNRLNMVTREGGAQPKEYLAKYAADRVRTVSMAWLGSTMGCAECHDHKYDPFTSKDFYQMEAFFADIKQWGVYMDYDYTPNPDLRGFSNDHPFPPEIQVESPYLHQRMARLQAKLNDLYRQAATSLSKNGAKQAALTAWREDGLAFWSQWPDGWATPVPQVALRMKDTNAVAETNFSVRAAAWVSLSSEPRESVVFTLPISNRWVSAIRVEVATRSESEETQANAKKRKGATISLSARLKPADGKEETPLALHYGDADYKEERYANGYSLLGVTDRWVLSKEHERQTAVWLLEKPIETRPGDAIVVSLGALGVASARVSVSPFAAPEPLKSGIGQDLYKTFSRTGWPRNKAERELIAQTYLWSSGAETDDLAKARKWESQIRECRDGRAEVLVTMAQAPLTTRVLRRGNWQDETGDVVLPLVPHFLPQITNPEGRRLTRLDLAKWLVSAENPLTARAAMNRIWKQFFGVGISSIVDDLGAQGEWPVHPELLDWLACEFKQPQGSETPAGNLQPAFPWDLKHMIRLLVLSAAYRQDSNERPELKEIDPNNRLVAYQSPRRLEAEFVRDNALSIAGLLDGDIGGPSSFPYQPAGYYAYLQFPDRDYHPNQDERQYRRGVYMHWQRTFLHPMLANFDAPAREECTANRVVSDTPQQALTLLNDPTFVEAARVFAETLRTGTTESDAQRLDRGFQRALDRPARENEKKSLLDFLAVQRDHYQEHPEETEKLLHIGLAPMPQGKPSAELAAWTQVCRVILNLHETITLY